MIKHQEYCDMIFEQMTNLQVKEVMDALLVNIKKDQINDVIDLLDYDTAETLTRIIYPNKCRTDEKDAISKPVKSTSDAKFEETWDDIVSDIQYIIDDVGIEDGPYVCQDRHWEPPDFMAYDVTQALEKEAKKLFPLLERSHELKLADVNFFKEIYVEINDNIGLYPEYYWGLEEAVDFGSNMTACVIKWLFLHASSAESFLGDVIKFEEDCEVDLDYSGIKETILDVYKENDDVLYKTLNSLRLKGGEWKRRLENPASVWHKIFYSLTEKMIQL